MVRTHATVFRNNLFYGLFYNVYSTILFDLFNLFKQNILITRGTSSLKHHTQYSFAKKCFLTWIVQFHTFCFHYFFLEVAEIAVFVRPWTCYSSVSLWISPGICLCMLWQFITTNSTFLTLSADDLINLIFNFPVRFQSLFWTFT